MYKNRINQQLYHKKLSIEESAQSNCTYTPEICKHS